MKSPDELIQPTESTDPYDVWLRSPTNTNMNNVVSSLRPTIDSAVKTYAGKKASPIVRSRAKLLTMRAVKSYDPARGAQLNTHVMNQLRSLTRYANQATQPMKMSERRVRQYHLLRRAEQDFEERYGRDPSDLELADRLGLSVKRINRVRTYGDPFVSASQDPETGNEDPAIYTPNKLETWIEYLYHDADNIDRKILEWKTGKNNKPILSNQEIAAKLKLTPMAVTRRAQRLEAKLVSGLEG